MFVDYGSFISQIMQATDVLGFPFFQIIIFMLILRIGLRLYRILLIDDAPRPSRLFGRVQSFGSQDQEVFEPDESELDEDEDEPVIQVIASSVPYCPYCGVRYPLFARKCSECGAPRKG